MLSNYDLELRLCGEPGGGKIGRVPPLVRADCAAGACALALLSRHSSEVERSMDMHLACTIRKPFVATRPSILTLAA